MTREFTCIICPNGCEISADYEIQADQSVVIHSLEGATCKRGAEYVKQELTDPKRNIALHHHRYWQRCETLFH